MTDLKYSILSTMYHSPNHEVDETVLFNQYPGVIREARTIVKDMMKAKPPLIENTIGKSAFVLTSCGVLEYELMKQKHDESTKQEAANEAKLVADAANVKSQLKKQLCHDLIVSAFTVLLTLLVEHFGKLIDILAVFFSAK